MWQTQDSITAQMKELARFSKQIVTTQNCRYKTHQLTLQVCHKDDLKVHEVSFRSGVDQTRSLFLVRQAFIDVRMSSQFPDSTSSKPETVVANPRIVWRNSEDLNDEEGLRQDSCTVG